MGFINNVRRMFGITVNGQTYEDRSQAHSAFGLDAWKELTGGGLNSADPYDNLFAYVQPLANKFSTIVPYAVDAKGEPIKPIPPAMDALYNPNDMFDRTGFFAYIVTVLLTQPHLDLLVWTGTPTNPKPGGKVTANNITGYTVLPQDSRHYDTSSRYTYYHEVQMPDANGNLIDRTFTREETICLTYSRHPQDPTIEIAPAMTVRKWASVDDFLADYERGFFRNGGIPAGKLNIVAASDDDFEKSVRQLDEAFRGAGNVNKPLYSRVPIDPDTAKPSTVSKIEFVPMQQTNDNLDISSINTIVNGRLSNAIPVPEIIRGQDTGQTYANAEQAVRAFNENTLDPLCRKVWGQFQFELDRITGGLGYKIKYDVQNPNLTDALKTQAETNQISANTMISLVNSGAQVVDVVKALGLSDDWNSLTLQPVAQTPATSLEIHNPPAQIVQNSEQPVTEIETPEESHSDIDAEHQKLEDRKEYGQALKPAKEALQKIIDRRTSSQNSAGDPDQAFLESVASDLVDGLVSVYMVSLLDAANGNINGMKPLLTQAAENNNALADALRDHMPDTWGTVPEAVKAKYEERLKVVGKHYVDDAWEKIGSILSKANSEQWNSEQTRKALNGYVDSDKARLLARNELIASEQLGSLYSAESLESGYPCTVYKVWQNMGLHPCPICLAMNGKRIGLHESFMDVGDSMEVEGHMFVNDFMPMETASAHPNDECGIVYEVE